MNKTFGSEAQRKLAISDGLNISDNVSEFFVKKLTITRAIAEKLLAVHVWFPSKNRIFCWKIFEGGRVGLLSLSGRKWVAPLRTSRHACFQYDLNSHVGSA